MSDRAVAAAGRLQAENDSLRAKLAAAETSLHSARLAKAAAEDERDAALAEAAHDREVLASYRGAFTTQKERADRCEAEAARLKDALEQSVRLQAHYAGLLNDWDGGQRIVFADANAWLYRLAALEER